MLNLMRSKSFTQGKLFSGWKKSIEKIKKGGNREEGEREA